MSAVNDWRDEITQWQIARNEVAAGLEGEGEDSAEASARADELGKVLDLMNEMEADPDDRH